MPDEDSLLSTLIEWERSVTHTTCGCDGCQEPLKDLLPYLDAANIDLKSFSDDIYMKVSGGHLQPVLDTILAIKQPSRLLKKRASVMCI